ncbi:MAG: alpha/beta fold hydrolase [Candidatus Vogelbacteria bacterium]
MKRAFIVHGWGGYPEEGWFPWLKQELEKKGFQVVVPTMPETDTPKIEAWVNHLANLVGQPDEETFLIGHSIGCQTILRYLERLPAGQYVGGVVLVAGWIHRLNGDLSPEELDIAKPWIETPLDLNKVKQGSKKFTAIFSDNDQFTRLMAENEEIFKNQLGAKVIEEHSKDHFSGDDGITELPSVLEAIK